MRLTDVFASLMFVLFIAVIGYVVFALVTATWEGRIALLTSPPAIGIYVALSLGAVLLVGKNR